MHIFWQQCFCDLYRSVYPKFKEAFSAKMLETLSPEFKAACLRKCYAHAIELAGVFELVLRLDCTEGFVITDSSVAHCAFQCVRILTQMRRVQMDGIRQSDVEQIASLCACSNVLIKLRETYPLVKKIVSLRSRPLRSILTNCHQSKRTSIPPSMNIRCQTVSHTALQSKITFSDGTSMMLIFREVSSMYRRQQRLGTPLTASG